MATLPARPRLRVSFWYEGEAAKCELVLMTERRALVHRETLDVGPGTGLERVHAGLLSAAATLATGAGASAAPPPAEAPEAPADARPAAPAPMRQPQPSAEELEADRQRRAERAEAKQRARGATLIENTEPAPETEPPKS